MQNIDLICVGKLNAKYFAEGVAEYQKRLAAFAPFSSICYVSPPFSSGADCCASASCERSDSFSA